MPEPTLDKIMSDWDPHAALWRLMCHRQAAQRLLDGQPERRVARPAPDARMPQEDAQDVVARVRAELQLRAGL